MSKKRKRKIKTILDYHWANVTVCLNGLKIPTKSMKVVKK